MVSIFWSPQEKAFFGQDSSEYDETWLEHQKYLRNFEASFDEGWFYPDI
jgi:hypothetical protein